MNDNATPRTDLVRKLYLKHFEKETRKSIGILEFAAVLYMVFEVIRKGEIPTDVPIYILLAIALVFIQWIVVKYRIDNGLFGNTEFEIRTLAEFAEKQAAQE